MDCRRFYVLPSGAFLGGSRESLGGPRGKSFDRINKDKDVRFRLCAISSSNVQLTFYNALMFIMDAHHHNSKGTSRNMKMYNMVPLRYFHYCFQPSTELVNYVVHTVQHSYKTKESLILLGEAF